MNYQNFISIKPGNRFGRPCVRNSRISVFDVLSYLASGMTEEEILSDYPELTAEDIKACRGIMLDRSGFYCHNKKRDDSVLIMRMRETAKTRVRYGFWRIFTLLRRVGFKDNHSRKCHALEVGQSIKWADVVNEMNRINVEYGHLPKRIR